MHERIILKVSFCKKARKRIWKNRIEEIVKEENDWDHMTEVSVVEQPSKKVICKEIAIAIKAMKPGKGARPSEVGVEVRISMVIELCEHMSDGIGMLDEWQTIVLLPIFKGKEDLRNCYAYRGVQLLEHTLKIVETE